MDLQSSFVDDLLHAEDEYEVMALCYNKLLEYTQDSDVLFVAKIEHLEKDREFEPFAQEFENLRQILISYSQEINVHFNLDGTGFDIFKNRLIDELSSFQCPEQIDISRWFPVCLFYVLDALDGYISKNIGLVRDKYRTFGPLNQGRSKTNCLVYFHEQESFLSVSYAEKDGHGEFRRPLRETRIGNLFHAVLLIPREQIPIVPRIAPVFLNDYCKESLSESKKLKIVSIPYIGFDTFSFSFHDACTTDLCTFGQHPKGLFHIDYGEQAEDDVQRIISLLQFAINRNANIIVFPEYIMSPKMLKGIEDHLKRLDSAQKPSLFLVLAGTCYHWANEKGNNILHILNANGIEIGSYYKHSPFLEQSEEKIHGALLQSKSEPRTKRSYFEVCEILSEPGKECTLIDVDIIGRILPAICRDVISGHTESLSNLFMPSFLIVPAWSRSVSSFDPRFSILADTIHTISLLCNCCNAVEGTSKKATGTIVVPRKQGTAMAAFRQKIIRKRNCTLPCLNHGGCIEQIEISFVESNPQVSLNKFKLK